MGHWQVNTLGARVRRAREAAGLSQQELARAVGIKQPSIQAIESGRAKGTKYIVAIARATKCSPDWLETGDGTQAANDTSGMRDTQPSASEIVTISDVNYARIAVFDMREGWPVQQPVDHHVISLQSLRSLSSSPVERIIGLQMDSDAMSPTIGSRDWVVVDRGLARVTGPGVYAFFSNGSAVIQRVARQPATGDITLSSDNAKYPPQTIGDQTRLDCIGRVVLAIVRA